MDVDIEVDEQDRPGGDHSSGGGTALTEEDALFDNGEGDVEPEAMTSANPSPQELLVTELVSEGMGLTQARRAVAEKYDAAAMQLDNLLHALPTEKLIPDDRGKWLYVAIKDGYGPTKGYARFLEEQGTKQRRREAQEKRDAAQRVKNEAERILFDELDLTEEEKAALRQKARNCVPPIFRNDNNPMTRDMIKNNYEALVLGKEVKDYGVWPVPGW